MGLLPSAINSPVRLGKSKAPALIAKSDILRIFDRVDAKYFSQIQP
jgi:hypothetical protein